MATLNSKIGEVIRGEHVMGEDELRDYHRVQAVKDAMRIKDRFARFQAVKSALNPYRVLVSMTADEQVRVFAPASRREVIL